MNKKNLFQLCLIITILFLGFWDCNSKKDRKPAHRIPDEKELVLFEKIITGLAKDLKVSQLSFAIVDERQVLKQKTISLEGVDKQLDETTVYPIGTLSDVFTAVILSKLEEQEKIKLKDYLSDYGSEVPGQKTATLKQVLTRIQTSGSVNEFVYDPAVFCLLNKVIEEVTEKTYNQAVEKYISGILDMNQTVVLDGSNKNNSTAGLVSSVSDLTKFSMAIDNRELFSDSATTDQMFRPAYLDNGEQAPTAIGWMVQYYQDKKILWSFGQGEGYSSLILKSATDSLTLILLANSANVNQAFSLQNGNVFNSPIATAFMKTCIFKPDTIPLFDPSLSSAEITSGLNKSKQSSLQDLLISEYKSYITLYSFVGQKDKVDTLMNIYQRVYPTDLPLSLWQKEPKAIIDRVGDYLNIRRSFQIKSDTTVTIFAVGEFIKTMQLQPWEYDNVELFFDMKNEKKNNFNVQDGARQYRFNYDSPDITGNFQSADSIRFVQADPSGNSYIFEISFPWKTLGFAKPANGVKIGFDIATSDNDGAGRKASLAWFSKKDETPWSNVSILGAMVLADGPTNSTKPAECISLKTTRPLKLDGKADAEWAGVPRYSQTSAYMLDVPKEDDLSTWFRSRWDDKNLYFLVEIHDNKKLNLPYTKDYGWIENEKHDTIWQMDISNSIYAGGALTNRFVNTTLQLKAGKYFLSYSSNQTNSFNRWIRKKPEMSFYGIAIY